MHGKPERVPSPCIDLKISVMNMESERYRRLESAFFVTFPPIHHNAPANNKTTTIIRG
jgi:hypothetical protein